MPFVKYHVSKYCLLFNWEHLSRILHSQSQRHVLSVVLASPIKNVLARVVMALECSHVLVLKAQDVWTK